MTFVTDLDGAFNINLGGLGSWTGDIFAYPGCGNGDALANGDAGKLYPSQNEGITNSGIRLKLSNANNDWHKLSGNGNGNNFPLIFEFINDPNAGTFTFKFSSPTFTNPLECVYSSSVTPNQDFFAYMSADGGDETIMIADITAAMYVFICDYL